MNFLNDVLSHNETMEFEPLLQMVKQKLMINFR